MALAVAEKANGIEYVDIKRFIDGLDPVGCHDLKRAAREPGKWPNPLPH
jgi:hypothetical protein